LVPGQSPVRAAAPVRQQAPATVSSDGLPMPTLVTASAIRLVGRRATNRRDTPTMTALIAARLSAVQAARNEAGMTTAEYAVGTVSACGFATLLYKLLTSSFGQNLLEGLFHKVLDILPF
jgi:uncharacterized protein DUF4244